MAINLTDVKVQFEYETGNNQGRIVLDIQDNEVVYVSRGNNVENTWNQRTKSSLSTFAQACDKIVGKVNTDKFNKIKIQNN